MIHIYNERRGRISFADGDIINLAIRIIKIKSIYFLSDQIHLLARPSCKLLYLLVRYQNLLIKNGKPIISETSRQRLRMQSIS